MSATPSTGDNMLFGRTTAALALLGHTGVQQVELAYDDDRNDLQASVLWWCGGNWNGTRLFSLHYPFPTQAAEDLLGRVMNGGMCKRCGRTTVVGLVLPSTYCCFSLVADDVDEPATYRYLRTCQLDAVRADLLSAKQQTKGAQQ